jgi:hypothetical protein
LFNGIEKWNLNLTHKHTIFLACAWGWDGEEGLNFPETYPVKTLPQIYFNVQNIGMKNEE